MQKINICISTESGHIFSRLKEILDLDKFNVIFSSQKYLLYNSQNKETRLNLTKEKIDYLFIKTCTIDKYGIDIKKVLQLIGHPETQVLLLECGGNFTIRCQNNAEEYLKNNNINYIFYRPESHLYDRVIEICDYFLTYLKKELVT